MMMAAYVRRKEWEAQLVAIAVWRLLGEAIGRRSHGRPGRRSAGEMSGMTLLNTIGAEA